MKIYLVAALTTVLFASCSMQKLSQKITQNYLGDHYRYTYSLNDGTADSVLKFEDDNIRTTFTISDAEINFRLYNKTNETLKIIWDEASIVQFGNAKPVIHQGIKYIDRNSSKPPSVIPANSTIDDLVLPADNIYYSEGYYGTYTSIPGSWQKRDLFVNWAKADSSKQALETFKGSSLIVYLPIKRGEKTVEYNFKFTVKDITCTTCKESATKPK